MNTQFNRWLLLLSIFLNTNISGQDEINTTIITHDETQTANQIKSINGAFGITLGKIFEHNMVAKVVSRQSTSYRDRDKSITQGVHIQVEPLEPDHRFQKYEIKTTADGHIFSIQAYYQYDVVKAKGKKAGKIKDQKNIRKICKQAALELAKELEINYGKPRGTGWDGEWFKFQLARESLNINVNLYANRCRTGSYSIVYTN